MKLVVDTNIIFSALLKRESKELLILTSSLHFEFFIPKFVFIELFKYKEKILQYSELSEEEVTELLHIIFENITIVNENQIPYEFRKSGYELTKDVDIKDSVFVALALALNSKLWSGDKKLKNHLIKKNRNLIVFTKDLLKEIK